MDLSKKQDLGLLPWSPFPALVWEIVLAALPVKEEG